MNAQQQKRRHRRKRDRWVVSHLPLVRGTARKLRLRVRVVDEEDLVSAGTIGLIEAVDRYDTGFGVPFVSFAYPRIRGAMIDEIRRLRVPAAERASEPVPSLSLDAAAADGSLTLLEVTVNPASPAPEAHAEFGELLEAMNRLPARERDMLRLYVVGNTLAEISSAFGCSESRTSQLIARARLRLEERTAA